MKSWLLLAYITSCFASALTAQNLRVVAQVNGSASTVSDGGSVQIPFNGRDALASFTISNAGLSTLRIDQIAITDGSVSWAIITPLSLPASLGPNGGLSFSVRYIPTSTTGSSAPLTVRYTEAGQARAFTATLVGSSADYVISFVDPTGQKIPVTPGTRLAFGSATPGSPRTASLTILNRGTTPGVLNSVAVSGRDFSTTVNQVAIPAGQEVTIPIVFNPQGQGLSTGAITLDLGFVAPSFVLEGAAASSATFTATYALRSSGNVRTLVNGGRLTFEPTSATTTAFADVAIVNQGTTPGTLQSITLSGSTFQLVNLPVLPATIDPGQSARFSVSFTPAQLGSFSANLRVDFDGSALTATVEGTTSNPQFSVSYIDPETNNVVPVAADGTLTFPGTVVESSTNLVVQLRNQGPGTGFLNAATVSGEGFQLTDLPILPLAVAPGTSARLGIRFTPRQRTLYTGMVAFDVAPGGLRVSLAGAGIAGEFNYEAAGPGEDPVRLPPNGELAFSTNTGQSVTKQIRITNVGNTERQITAINITGEGFQLANVPFLPVTIPVNGSEILSVVFSPAQPGSVRGRLRIGNDMFDLAGTGIAPRLEFSYTNDAGTTSVNANGTIILTSTRVGETSRVEVSLRNTGTSAVAISSIEALPTNTVYAIENPPALPVNVEPGAGLQFGVRFAPNNIGAITGLLRVNNTEFTLSGNGRQPVAIPDYQVTGPSGVQPPLQQPAVGLTLASPYSLPLRGALNLTFSSDVFTSNPAVQFATGGRTVNFTIPAGATQATFENGSSQVRLQTGTVAGTIQLTPTFATTAGLDVTPPTPTSLSMTINRLAPQLQSVDIAARTANSITLQVNGYSTTRMLRTVDVQLAPRGDANFSATTLRFNIESSTLAWFQTAQSEPFGGLFSLTIPLTLSRGDSTEDLIRYIQSVAITVANEVGASSSVSVTP